MGRAERTNAAGRCPGDDDVIAHGDIVDPVAHFGDHSSPLVAEYRRRGLKAKNLSRALEDAGTLTSPLVPWNTCGAFMAQTLGVPTFSYFFYCFFNMINPFISAIYGFTGFTIEKLPDEETEEESA